MKTFEYKVIGHPFYIKDQEDLLNQLGQEGWELVVERGGMFYLKRRPAKQTCTTSTTIGGSSICIYNGINTTGVTSETKGGE